MIPDTGVRPRVYSKRKGAEPPPADAVYVGRPTKYGNPFVVQSGVNTQEEAVRAYRDWIWQDEQEWLRMQAAWELHGLDLVCWCAPEPCHADILLEIANPPSRREAP